MLQKNIFNKKLLSLVFTAIVCLSAGLVASPVLLLGESNANVLDSSSEIEQSTKEPSTSIVTYPTDWETGCSVDSTIAFSKALVEPDKLIENYYATKDNDLMVETTDFITMRYGSIHDTAIDGDVKSLFYKISIEDLLDKSGSPTTQFIFQIDSQIKAFRTGTLHYFIYLTVGNETDAAYQTYSESDYSITEDHLLSDSTIRLDIETTEYWDGTEDTRFYLKIYNANTETYDFIITNATASGIDDWEYFTITIAELWFQPDSIEYNLRSDYRYTSTTVIQHRLFIENPEYATTITVKPPLSWNFTSINPSATTTISSNNLVITNTVPVTYEIIFLSGGQIAGSDGIVRQNQFLSHSVEYNYDFEDSQYSTDFSSSYSSTAINSSIVSQNAFSLALTCSNTSSFQVKYKNDLTTYSINLDSYTQNRWHTQFISVHFTAALSSTYVLNFATNSYNLYLKNEIYGEFLLAFDYYIESSTKIFLDNINLLESNNQLITTAYNEQLFGFTLNNIDNIENKAVINQKVNSSIYIRHNQTILESYNLTTNSEGYASFVSTLTSSQLQNELELYTYAYNTASSVLNTTKSYLQPLQIEYNNEYFDNEKDFSEGTQESASFYRMTVDSVSNGYISMHPSQANPYHSDIGFTGSIDADYYTYCIIRTKANVSDVKVAITDYTGTGDRVGTSQSITTEWDTYVYDLSLDEDWSGIESGIAIYYDEDGGDSQMEQSDQVYLDYVFLCHKDTVSLLETSSYFFTTSVNNTLQSYATLNSNLIDESWNDLEQLQKDLDTNTYTLEYIVWNDLDAQNCYIHSSTYSSSYTISEAAFTVEIEDFNPVTSSISLYVTANKDGNYQIYENDTLKGSGTLESTGTVITHSKNTAESTFVNLAYKFWNSSDTRWFNTSYSNADPAAFSFEEFLEIGDWQCEYQLETNKPRDSVRVFLMLNDSYVEFPSGNYYALPGVIVFSRPSYGIYNFTRIVEYSGTNYTRQTWITITSNAEIVNFNVDGLKASDDYITVHWNTNKGSGTINVLDNGSSVATSPIEGVFRFQKSTTEGLHNLTFAISVESKTLYRYANYTVLPWSATVSISGDDRVDIDTNTSLTITVIRSDEGSFSGTVTINGENITVTGGTGTYYKYDSNYNTHSITASAVYDGSGDSRTFSTNTFTLRFDFLYVALSKSTNIPTANQEIMFSVNLTRLNDGSIPTVYSYKVYINSSYVGTVYNSQEFYYTPNQGGTYTVELKYVYDKGENLEEYTSHSISFIVAVPSTSFASDETFGGTVFTLVVGGFVTIFVLGTIYNIYLYTKRIQRDEFRKYGYN